MERSHLIVDKDTQQVFDIRKDMDMARLDRQTSVKITSGTSGAAVLDTSSPRLGSEASVGNNTSKHQSGVGGGPRKSTKAKPWENLWKVKRQNNADFLLAAEAGEMQEMLDLIDPTKKML